MRERTNQPGNVRWGKFDILQALFIISVCFTAWFPLSIEIGGLNLRASQICLPLVIFLLVTHPAKLSVRLVATVAAALGWWGVTVFWTIVGSSNEFGHPLGRLFLIVLNIVQFAASYLLLRKTGSIQRALMVFWAAVAVLNLMLLMISAIAAIGVSIPTALMNLEEVPVLVNGSIGKAEVLRFVFGGVMSGCISAGAALAGISFYLKPPSDRPRYLLPGMILTVVGMILGFSRQCVVSLVLGLLLIGVHLVLTGKGRQMAKVAVVSVVVAGLAVVILNSTPAGSEYIDAFVGRTAQMGDAASYTSGTFSSRTEMWSGMWTEILRNPFIGNGQDAYLRYMVNYGEQGSHNLPLEVLHASGIFGFVSWLILHLIIAVAAFRSILLARRVSEEIRYELLGLLAASVAIVAASISNLIFWNPSYWMILGLLLGASDIILRQATRRYKRERVDLAGARLSMAEN